MKLLRNICPLGYIDVPLLGRSGDYDHESADSAGVGCLFPGEIFEVSNEKAGEGPHWRPKRPDDNLRWLSIRETGEGTEVLDRGLGLLAQTSNFELVADSLSDARVEDLRTIAEQRRIDIKGATKRADILALVKKG